jgi:hypothetical protein
MAKYLAKKTGAVPLVMTSVRYYLDPRGTSLGPRDRAWDHTIESIDKAVIRPGERIELLVILESSIGLTFDQIRWVCLSLEFAE